MISSLEKMLDECELQGAYYMYFWVRDISRLLKYVYIVYVKDAWKNKKEKINKVSLAE